MDAALCQMPFAAQIRNIAARLGIHVAQKVGSFSLTYFIEG